MYPPMTDVDGKTLLPLLPSPPTMSLSFSIVLLLCQFCVPHLKVVSGNLHCSYLFTLTMNTIATTPKTSPPRKPVDFYFVGLSSPSGFFFSPFLIPHPANKQYISFSLWGRKRVATVSFCVPLLCKSKSIEIYNNCKFVIYILYTLTNVTRAFSIAGLI